MSTTVKVSVCYPPVVPNVVSPSDGTETDESSIVVTGSATHGNTVYAVRDGVEVGFVSVPVSGEFSISVALGTGVNTIIIREKNPCDEAADTAPFMVISHYLPPEPPSEEETAPDPSPTTTAVKPSLGVPGQALPPSRKISAPPPAAGVVRPVITRPKHGFRTAASSVIVSGEAEPQTVVRILRDGRQVASLLSDNQGKFTAIVGLETGINELLAVTGSGETQLRSNVVVVHYEPSGQLGPVAIPEFPVLVIGFSILGTLIIGALAFRHGGLSGLGLWKQGHDHR